MNEKHKEMLDTVRHKLKEIEYILYQLENEE